MSVLGGNKEHKWADQSTKGKSKTHSGYTHSDDIAGQLLDEESVKDVCKLDSDYYEKNESHFLRRFFGFFRKIKSPTR
ncbi:MAG: hypothetical protein ACI9BD_000449 [Candidatus Marinamargulisbacteria bacterium]|jgi:hypothetical protein